MVLSERSLNPPRFYSSLPAALVRPVGGLRALLNTNKFTQNGEADGQCGLEGRVKLRSRLEFNEVQASVRN